MLKTLNQTIRKDKEKFKVPKKVQDIIPIKEFWKSGIFRVADGKYSMTFKFEDINYKDASLSDQENMFLGYSQLLNSMESGTTIKISVHNRHLNKGDFKEHMLMALKGDGLDQCRTEYNRILMDKATGASAIVQDRYITVSAFCKDKNEAERYFQRIGTSLATQFGRLGSKCHPLDGKERMRIIHDFFRPDEDEFDFDMEEIKKQGQDFKDKICPESYENDRDYFRIGDKFGRSLFLRDYANYIPDTLLQNLTDMERNVFLSIDFIPIPTDEAIREVENRLLGEETNITNWQRRQNQNNNFSAIVPYDMEMKRAEGREMVDDLTTKDQRMNIAVLTMVHIADSKEQLDGDTKDLMARAGEKASRMATLRFQQLEGLLTAMPFGVRKIDAFRTLITESLAALMPFHVQEISDGTGIYYGQNATSGNMIIADRTKLMNGNSFILGVSGSGKSFAGKNEIASLALSTDADIIIIDPEKEYGPLVSAMGGEVVEISATSGNHINAMDMDRNYGDADPIIEKSQFLQSLCEQIIAGHQFSKGQQSIIDRCTEQVYRFYKQGDYQGEPPTLNDFREELLKQPEAEAQALALELELFTRGSLNTFAKQTNVDTNNRLICYDISELGSQLMPIGMLVVLDSILNRITANRNKGKQTFIFIDEIYLLFMHEYSAQFLFKLWKRVRKYGAFCCGLTQNVDDLLQSHTARTMLSNSEFVMMLNQAEPDRRELAKLLNISDAQMNYITNAEVGNGLLRFGSALVPFINSFPKDTKLYKLMSTKFNEEF